MKALVLDSGPLGLLSNPSIKPEVFRIHDWVENASSMGWTVFIPEIADYEIRRELLLIGKTKSIERLDSLRSKATYLPITTETMRLAAELWATSRRIGKPLADRHALDGDVIVTAQVKLLDADQALVATSNVGHLNQFVDAREWQEIVP